MQRHRKMLVVLLALPSVACQTTALTPPANCSEFVPADWRAGVAGAPLPADDTLPEWQKFGVAQSGQLEKSNGRLGDTMHILSTCERRANDARPRSKILGIF